MTEVARHWSACYQPRMNASFRHAVIVLALALSAACGSSSSSSSAAPPGSGDGGVPDGGGDAGGPSAAACTATPQKLYATSNGLLSMAADAANLYVAERSSTGDTIWRIPKSGAAPVALAADIAKKDESQVQAIAVDGGFVYWVAVSTGAELTGSIGRVPTTGGAATTLVANRPVNFYGNILVAADNVYWTEASTTAPVTGNVARMASAGGAVSTIATGPDSRVPEQLAAGDGFVFFTLAGDDNNVSSAGKKLMRAPLGGGAAEEVAATMGLDDALATNATSILYESGDKVAVLPLGGGPPSALLDFVGPTAIVADDKSAYAIDGSSVVKRAALDASSPPTELSDHADALLRSIAVDDKCVYWTNLNEGLFMREK